MSYDSASSTTSPVISDYLPVHSTCAEGMHTCPATSGVTIGTGRMHPRHTAHSAAHIFHFRPCEARQRLTLVSCINVVTIHIRYSSYTSYIDRVMVRCFSSLSRKGCLASLGRESCQGLVQVSTGRRSGQADDGQSVGWTCVTSGDVGALLPSRSMGSSWQSGGCAVVMEAGCAD